MREKLESLPLGEVREIARGLGIKRVTTIRKGELIDMILELKRESDERNKEDSKNVSNNNQTNVKPHVKEELTPEKTEQLDSGIVADGILEVMPDGYGFIRCENFLPGDNDVYVAPSQIRKFNLKTGDILHGKVRVKTQNEKFGALLYLDAINGMDPETAI